MMTRTIAKFKGRDMLLKRTTKVTMRRVMMRATAEKERGIKAEGEDTDETQGKRQ
jgi:hypothetical protein